MIIVVAVVAGVVLLAATVIQVERADWAAEVAISLLGLVLLMATIAYYKF